MWKNYYNSLSKHITSIIGASDDDTGNIKYGGDWILESTNEDIRDVYFTEDIENYAYKFDTTTLSSSTNISNTDFNGYTWPVSISGGTSSSPVEITLTENITTPSTASRNSIYFKIESDYIIFNGNNKTITYDSGNQQHTHKFRSALFQNGSSGSIFIGSSTGNTINNSIDPDTDQENYQDVNGYGNITIKDFSIRFNKNIYGQTFYGGILFSGGFGRYASGDITLKNINIEKGDPAIATNGATQGLLTGAYFAFDYNNVPDNNGDKYSSNPSGTITIDNITINKNNNQTFGNNYGSLFFAAGSFGQFNGSSVKIKNCYLCSNFSSCIFHVGSFRNIAPSQNIKFQIENNYIESTVTDDQFTAFINITNNIWNYGVQGFGYNSTPKLKIYVRNNIIKSQTLTSNLFINGTLTPDNHSLVNSSRQDLYDNYLTDDVFNLYFFNNYFMCAIDSTTSNFTDISFTNNSNSIDNISSLILVGDTISIDNNSFQTTVTEFFSVSGVSKL